MWEEDLYLEKCEVCKFFDGDDVGPGCKIYGDIICYCPNFTKADDTGEAWI